MVGLLDWLADPTDERGIRFADDPDGWTMWTFARLARATLGAAARLRAAGVRRGDVVAIVIPSSPAFVAAYYGALHAGATPAPLVPPTFFEDRDGYVARTAELLRTGVAHVAIEPSLRELVTTACARAGLQRPPVAIVADEEPGSAPPRSAPAELALLQFSSGSTGRPRGVRVSWENLEANIAMFAAAFAWGLDESGAIWLPLYHDMGLIAGVLNAVSNQRDGWLMRPEQFVMDPLRWLDRFGRGNAVFTAAPNFAFSFCVSKLRPADLEGTDFSRWRIAVTGAERVDPKVLGRFAELLAPHGFRRETFRPAYGLAEATLGVTMLASGRARAVRPRWEEMSFGQPVPIAARAEVGDARVGDGAGWLVGCGTPFPGVGVTIVDDAGATLPEGALGEIRVTGPTVARGYVGAASPLTRFEGGALRTGDAGFLEGGDLFVLGRLGDTLKLRGRTLYAEDLESKLATVPGMPVGRCVVLPGPASAGAVVALVERPPGPWVSEAARVLSREAGREARVRILCGGRGAIVRTTSGKPRRRVMWQAMLDGKLAAQEVFDSASATTTFSPRQEDAP